MRYSKIFNSLFVVIIFLSVGVSTSFSELSREEIIENAKKEKELVWYTSMPEENAWRILYEFNDLYPFINVSLYREGSFSVKEKYTSELAEGDVKVDVIHTADVGMFLEFQDTGHLLYYNSPEYEYFPPDYKSPGYWATMRGVSVCIAYNASKVPQDEAPRSWEDIRKSGDKWKGKIAIGNVARGGGTMYAQYYFLRKLYGVEYWKDLVRLDPLIKTASFTIRDMLVAGEVDVTLTNLGYQVYNVSIKEGKPIRGVWPEDGVPMQPCPIAIVKEAPHPNAARLFMDFALSLEGQALCQAIVGCYSVREGIPALPGKIPFSEIEQPFQIDWQDYTEKQDEYKKEFAEIFEEILKKQQNEKE
jgi:iron(III) transport system substrate-binding protein